MIKNGFQARESQNRGLKTKIIDNSEIFNTHAVGIRRLQCCNFINSKLMIQNRLKDIYDYYRNFTRKFVLM